MTIELDTDSTLSDTHAWLRRLNIVFMVGQATPLLGEFTGHLKKYFLTYDHLIQETPDNSTDLIVTTASFSEPVPWRNALLFTARRRFNLQHHPTVCTVIRITPAEFSDALNRFRHALSKDEPDRKDFSFPGLAPQAYKSLFKQGRRGGPILAMLRLLQAQCKCIRVILVVGDSHPIEAYLFDLVGAHPRIKATDSKFFYRDIVLRMVTVLSTNQVAEHQVYGQPIPRNYWQELATPPAMSLAGQQFGMRNFFDEMIRIADLISVPALNDAIASQYSEGCFATWDPSLKALITTVSGSATPVSKSEIHDNNLSVVVAVRPDSKGTRLRHVMGLENNLPSSEAFELIDMDSMLPRIKIESNELRNTVSVPVVRSKLHGHRIVSAYHPNWIEYTALDPAYFQYPVPCATRAQAIGIKKAFSRASALQRPEDPRQIIFTTLPGHGVLIVEKWVPNKLPFQVIWECMDAGLLQIESCVPQGQHFYEVGANGMQILKSV